MRNLLLGLTLVVLLIHGKTPLHLAAEFDPDPGTVRALVQGGASLEARDEWGRTPLMAAARRNTAPVVEALLAAGADPQARDNDGRTAYAWAQGNRKLQSAPVLWVLHDRQYGAR